MLIDVHTHTTYSDGSDSVKELLTKAAKVDLQVLSITDHNSVKAYFDFWMSHQKQLFNGTIINGVELTTTYHGEIVEVLGYGIDVAVMDALLEKNVYSFEQKQLKEFELIKQTYQARALPFNYQLITFDPKTTSCRKAFWQQVCQNPQLAKQVYQESSLLSSSKFTRQEVYNPLSMYYVDQTAIYPNLFTCVDMIHASHGKAFLAHLFNYANWDSMFCQLAEIVNQYQLDGIECIYSSFTQEQSQALIHFCDANHLLKSGGSDYHGQRKPTIALGGVHIPKEWVNQWQIGIHL